MMQNWLLIGMKDMGDRILLAQKNIYIMVMAAVFMLLLGGCSEQNQENDAPPEQPDDTIYVGEYLDSDVGGPNLEIAKGEDGTYIVQIGIYRLTSLNDGVGELTEEGMKFTATDAAGNPISGIITVEGETATVTFTDSTWDYLKNGDSFSYTKSSDMPKIWE